MMSEWIIVTVVITLIGLITPFVTLSVKTTKVIQQNTDAINNLTTEINSLTVSNNKDHDHFHSCINKHSVEIAILQEKHKND